MIDRNTFDDDQTPSWGYYAVDWDERIVLWPEEVNPQILIEDNGARNPYGSDHLSKSGSQCVNGKGDNFDRTGVGNSILVRPLVCCFVTFCSLCSLRIHRSSRVETTALTFTSSGHTLRCFPVTGSHRTATSPN